MLSYLIRLLIFENFFKHKERYFCGYKDMEKEEVKRKCLDPKLVVKKHLLDQT